MDSQHRPIHNLEEVVAAAKPTTQPSKPRISDYMWDVSQRLERHSVEHSSTWTLLRLVEQGALQSAVFEVACGAYTKLCLFTKCVCAPQARGRCSRSQES